MAEERNLKLLTPVYTWQSWPRNYEPTLSDLEAMSSEEYDCYWAEYSRNQMREIQKELGARLNGASSELKRSMLNHPTNG
jgi:hypothetical protein